MRSLPGPWPQDYPHYGFLGLLPSPPPQHNFNWPLLPSPDLQVFSLFSLLHTRPLGNPSRFRTPHHNARVMDSSVQGGPPHLTPCIPQPPYHLSPVWSRHLFSPQHLGDRLNCPSLSFALPLLSLGRLFPISSQFSKTPLSIVSTFSHCVRPNASRDSHIPLLCPLPDRHLLSPLESLRPLYPHKLDFSFFPSSQLPSSPSSTPPHPPVPPASCPAPKFWARFPGTKQEKSE